MFPLCAAAQNGCHGNSARLCMFLAAYPQRRNQDAPAAAYAAAGPVFQGTRKEFPENAP